MHCSELFCVFHSVKWPMASEIILDSEIRNFLRTILASTMHGYINSRLLTYSVATRFMQKLAWLTLAVVLTLSCMGMV